MPKKATDKSNEFKRRKRWKQKVKAIILRDRRRVEKGARFKVRELEKSKRGRAQIVKEGEEIAKKRKRGKKIQEVEEVKDGHAARPTPTD